jgi:uncharacterized coiled-coil DUF342 family protein
LTAQEKKSELERISKELSALREQVDSFIAGTKEQVEKRDSLNEKFKKLRQEIREFKNERDDLNSKVKTLKLLREGTRAKIKVRAEEIKAHNKKIAELKKKTSRESRRAMQKEFDDIEWKIQTTSLDMQEEKRLMDRVKQLETQLSVYKKIDQHIKRISEIRKEIESFEENADAAHQELTEIAGKSQDIHAKMVAKMAESKDIKAEADSLHSNYIQAREQIRPIRDEIKKLTEKRRKLQATIREEDAGRKKSVNQALRERLGSQAKEKLQRGEKLSLAEFKLLADDDQQD